MTYLFAVTHRWLLVVLAVTGWQLATAAADHPFFPSPWRIARQCVTIWFTTANGGIGLDRLVDDILPSLERVLGGWAIAAVLGVSIGTALGRSRTAIDYVGGLFAFLRAIPPPVLLPVFITLFGLTPTMGLALVIFGCLWPILLNTIDGVRAIDPVQTDTARSFRIPRIHWITVVVLPAALPKIFAGLRVSLPIAVILMVISEMVGVTSGIGYQLDHATSLYDIETMWAWIVLLGLLGYTLNTLLLAVERRALRWRPERAEARHQ